MKSKYFSMSFAVFGLMCGVFAFFTEVNNTVIIIPSSFYLQMGILSMLAGLYFEKANNKM
ncbi:MAG: hypothetical protein HZC01_00760 [Candidatus Kerfeldbacteria bacterium]|nr:hypothetical protein [Candidatus Kerfeldbacteria bacterium]